MPVPMPVAVPPPPPKKPRPPPPPVEICEVRVTTESRTLATTPVMSSCWIVVEPPDAWFAAAAFAEEAGAPAWAWGTATSTRAKVEPEAISAARSAVPTTVPIARRLREPLEAGAGAPDAWKVGDAVCCAAHAAGDGCAGAEAAAQPMGWLCGRCQAWVVVGSQARADPLQSVAPAGVVALVGSCGVAGGLVSGWSAELEGFIQGLSGSGSVCGVLMTPPRRESLLSSSLDVPDRGATRARLGA